MNSSKSKFLLRICFSIPQKKAIFYYKLEFLSQTEKKVMKKGPCFKSIQWPSCVSYERKSCLFCNVVYRHTQLLLQKRNFLDEKASFCSPDFQNKISYRYIWINIFLKQLRIIKLLFYHKSKSNFLLFKLLFVNNYRNVFIWDLVSKITSRGTHM